jgi:hypothetical protein
VAVEWDSGDSVAGLLAGHVDTMQEVSTLRMLGDAIAAMT